MKSENMLTWCRWMEETDHNQVEAFLMRFQPDGTVDGYCCLGLGSHMMGIEPDVMMLNDEGNGALVGRFDHVARLAPVVFRQWLGLQLGKWPVPEEDVCIDYDEGLMTPSEWPYRDDRLMGASGLNDNGFTFKQIADTVRYFGLRHEDGSA